MGVNPTPSNFKTFTFDNTNSAQYGVYITGQSVFNAPERNVEMVEIPGRDGAYALDKGNFNNIEITYPAGIVADTEADFATAVSNLRNFLCSKTGYCRLTDDYNSGEYRMAVYKSGLEVTHDMLIAGEFNIVFECKPQRWLTSGETKTTLTSGNAITNPTLFPSRPQLQVYGYGDIDIGGQEISVANNPLGNITLLEPYSYNNNGSYFSTNPIAITYTIDSSLVNNGNVISVEPCVVKSYWKCDMSTYKLGAKSTYTFTDTNVDGHDVSFGYSTLQNANIAAQTTMSASSFVKGTSSTYSASTTMTLPLIKTSDGTSTGQSLQVSVSASTSYNGSNSFTTTITTTVVSDPYSIMSGYIGTSYQRNTVSANSTVQATQPLYVDLDIGEAYSINNGTVISANDAVGLPAELPTLPSGATTITFDNTFTKVDIIPRWWKV